MELNKNPKHTLLLTALAAAAILVFLFLACVALFVFTPLGSKANPVSRFVITITPTETVTNTPKPTNTHRPTSTPRPTKTPRPTPTPQYGSKKMPVGFGDTITLGNGSDNYLEITVIDVVRGDEAWNKVRSGNMFNEEPAPDMEYMVAEVLISYLKELPDVGEIFQVPDIEWKSLTNGHVFGWDEPSFVCCFGDGEIVIGETSSVFVVRQVYVNDENPMLIFMDKFFFETR